jgi:hypothetical protein
MAGRDHLDFSSHTKDPRPAVLGDLAGGTEKSVSTESQVVDHSRQILFRLSISARTVVCRGGVANHSLHRTRKCAKDSAPMAYTQGAYVGLQERRGWRAVITKCLNCGHHRDAHEHYRRGPSDTECALCNCSKFTQRRRSFFGWLARMGRSQMMAAVITRRSSARW